MILPQFAIYFPNLKSRQFCVQVTKIQTESEINTHCELVPGKQQRNHENTSVFCLKLKCLTAQSIVLGRFKRNFLESVVF